RQGHDQHRGIRGVGCLFLLSASHATAEENGARKTVAGHLSVEGQKMYYETCGAGMPVVLLHDGMLHAVTWDRIWATLCNKFHVVRYDRRGYGRSDVPQHRFSPTDDLHALLAHLHVQKSFLVGSSSGAALAIDFALEQPQAIQGLFLIGPVVHGMLDSAHFLK